MTGMVRRMSATRQQQYAENVAKRNVVKHVSALDESLFLTVFFFFSAKNYFKKTHIYKQ